MGNASASIPAYLVVAIFTGVGLEALAGWARLAGKRYLPAVLLVIPAALLVFNHEQVDQSDNNMVAERSEELLDLVGQRAVIITSNYNWSQYLWYYLIGEGWGDERELFVMHNFDPHAVRSYLLRGKKIHLREQRRDVPAGLAVYCFSEVQADALVEIGLRLEPVVGNVVRVLAPAQSQPGGR